MPERVYMNRRTGEERIHIEITREEITEMLDRPTAPATRRFWELLAEAENQFDGPVRQLGQQPAPAPTPGCPSKHPSMGRICELRAGHDGMHTGTGARGGAVWERVPGDAE